MKIRVLVSLAGADYSLNPGDETSRFTPAEAVRLISSGAAVAVNDGQFIETADRIEPARETRRKKVKS